MTAIPGDIDAGCRPDATISDKAKQQAMVESVRREQVCSNWLLSLAWPVKKIIRRLRNHSSYISLHPVRTEEDPYLSSNSIRRIKCIVEEGLDIKFDLRMCRRTFGQRYLDKGLDIESTSVLIGHASTKTTEGYYSRRKLSQAIKRARNLSE